MSSIRFYSLTWLNKQEYKPYRIGVKGYDKNLDIISIFLRTAKKGLNEIWKCVDALCSLASNTLEALLTSCKVFTGIQQAVMRKPYFPNVNAETPYLKGRLTIDRQKKKLRDCFLSVLRYF